MQNTQQLVTAISRLSEEQKQAVEEFIAYIQKNPPRSGMPFREAADKFFREHAELMRRLAE
jgi:hypothetical protein